MSSRRKAPPVSAPLVTALFFALFAVLLLTSNRYDWDFFFSTLEVDRRSWLLEGAPPLWSYQLCGGVTRLGDPQSFGLSPLFLIPLVFGSFWGAKLLVLVSTAVGVFSLRKILALVCDSVRLGAAREAEFEIAATSLLFAFGNYFLWHFNSGHVTFLLIHWALIPVYLTLKGLTKPLSRRDVVLGALSVFVIFTGGFFHAVAFFITPFYVALGVFLLGGFALGRGLAKRPAGLKEIVTLHLAGAAAAGFKLYGVAQYQARFPRTLESAPLDSVGPLKLLAYQLLPTVGFQLFPNVPTSPVYMIWEYSAFSLLPWCALALVVLLRPRKLLKSSWLWGLLAVYGVVLFSFSFGDGPLSLHWLLNRTLLANSLRAPGRYQIGACLAFACVIALLLPGASARTRRAVRLVFIAALVAAALNFATFLDKTGTVTLQAILADQAPPQPELHHLIMTEPRTQSASFMYRATRHNLGVLNCYMPLTHFAPVERSLAADARVELPLLFSPRGEKLAAFCLEGSTASQRTLHVDPSCPRALCLNVNDLNPYEPLESDWLFDAGRNRFCRGLAARPGS